MHSPVEARRAEIARRYKAKNRGRRVSLAALRIGELNRLYAARYGTALPDDDAGRDEALIMAHHFARRPGDPARRIAAGLETWAPWITGTELSDLVAAVIAKPLRWRADTLAKRLNLTDAERRRVRITTIGAVDATKAEREARRRERERVRKEQRRRAANVKPRARYLAEAASRTRPWTATGLTRRTWYRRRAGTSAAAA